MTFITAHARIARRAFPGLFLTTLAATALIQPDRGAAQTYPTRPIRVIVPQSAGGSTDVVARVVAQRLTDVLGQSVIVDNRPGAGSLNGTDLVAKAAPDGYTLLTVAASFTKWAKVVKAAGIKAE